jgi:hypothetical protein
MVAAVVAAIFCALFAVNSPAATMNYGDFMGATITYHDVTEENGEPTLLFSAPSVVGDTLEFNPVNFLAEIDPGPGAEIVDSTIVTVLEAKPGFFINNIEISELGDYTLIGLPAAFAQAEVGAAFFFEVLAVDGVLVGDGPTGSVNMLFTSGAGPNGGEFSLPGDACTAVAWEGTAFLDIDAVMAASPYAGQSATSLRLTFDNTLAVAADANASAFIKKKEIGGIIIRTNIPEPTTIALVASLAVGACGIVVMRRRLG